MSDSAKTAALRKSGPVPPAGPSELVFSVSRGPGGTVLAFSGVLSVHTLHLIENEAASAVQSSGTAGPVRIDLEALRGLDTAGALFVNRMAEQLKERGLACSFLNSNDLHAQLLKKSVQPKEEKSAEVGHPFVVVLCNSIGKRVIDELELVGQLVGFFGKFLATTGRLLLAPHKMRWTSLVFHMEQVGLRAVPIVGLLTFLIGMVVAYMGAQQLERFGAQVFAVNLLEVTVMREMAVLITAIVVAGRSSSSFTAQLGAMVANEEVDALRSMGLDPNVLLVAPRVVALILCLPMLVFIADMMALLGGALAIWYSMGMTLTNFISEFHQVANYNNFLVGIIKTPFFAAAIGIVGCFQGFRATTSAESVGFLTTISVVQAIFIVIVLDAIFAIFFTTVGF